jgi:hypothetical protein
MVANAVRPFQSGMQLSISTILTPAAIALSRAGGRVDRRYGNALHTVGHHRFDLTYIEALLSRSVAMVDLACRAHLASAKVTLLNST